MRTYALILLAGGVLQQVDQHDDLAHAEEIAQEWTQWEEYTDEEGNTQYRTPGYGDAYILLIVANDAGIAVDLVASY